MNYILFTIFSLLIFNLSFASDNFDHANCHRNYHELVRENEKDNLNKRAMFATKEEFESKLGTSIQNQLDIRSKY